MTDEARMCWLLGENTKKLAKMGFETRLTPNGISIENKEREVLGYYTENIATSVAAFVDGYNCGSKSSSHK